MSAIRAINNKKQVPQPVQQDVNMTPLELAALSWGKCLSCGNETFYEVLKFKLVSAMHPKNSLGRPAKIFGKVFVCVMCKCEIDKKKEG